MAGQPCVVLQTTGPPHTDLESDIDSYTTQSVHIILMMNMVNEQAESKGQLWTAHKTFSFIISW